MDSRASVHILYCLFVFHLKKNQWNGNEWLRRITNWRCATMTTILWLDSPLKGMRNPSFITNHLHFVFMIEGTLLIFTQSFPFLFHYFWYLPHLNDSFRKPVSGCSQRTCKSGLSFRTLCHCFRQYRIYAETGTSGAFFGSCTGWIYEYTNERKIVSRKQLNNNNL